MRCGMSNGSYYAKQDGNWTRCRQDGGHLRLEWHYRVMDYPDRLDFVDPLGVAEVSIPKRGFMEYPEMWREQAALSVDGAGFREVPSWLKRSELLCTIQRHATLLFALGFGDPLTPFAEPFSPGVVRETDYLVRNGVRQFEGLDGATVRVSEGPAHPVAVIRSGSQAFDVDLTGPLIADFLVSTEPIIWS